MVEHLVSSWGITVFRAAMYIGEAGYASDKSARYSNLRSFSSGRLFKAEVGIQFDTACLPEVAQLVDDIVAWGEEFGVYIIIDWHASASATRVHRDCIELVFEVLTPGDPNHWLTGAGASQADAAAYWRETAQKYRNKTHVLYEICNEPNGVDWPTVKTYADNIIGVIREAHATDMTCRLDWAIGSASCKGSKGVAGGSRNHHHRRHAHLESGLGVDASWA